jgi:ribosomal-protein-alanine N-acetyltransferase
MSVDLIPAALVHADLLAGMHRICFADPWSADSMVAALIQPGTAGLLAVEDESLTPSLGGAGPAGMILWRVAADEAEILTLAVLPPWRRRGIARALLTDVAKAAASEGARALFLEVAVTNPAAQSLYQAVGFHEVGRRSAYYPDGGDALVLRKDLI